VLVTPLLSALVVALPIQNSQRHLAVKHFCMLFKSSRDALMIPRLPSWKYSGVNQATVELFGAASAAEFTALGSVDVSLLNGP
jgi:hypothetical protein